MFEPEDHMAGARCLSFVFWYCIILAAIIVSAVLIW